MHCLKLTVLSLFLAVPKIALHAQSSLDQMVTHAKQMDGVNDVKIEVPQNRRHANLDCEGHNARVIGNNNVLFFQNCETVSVLGNRNTVRVVKATAIKTYGNSNQVTWLGDDKPEIENPGNGNKIQQGSVRNSTAAASTK